MLPLCNILYRILSIYCTDAFVPCHESVVFTDYPNSFRITLPMTIFEYLSLLFVHFYFDVDDMGLFLPVLQGLNGNHENGIVTASRLVLFSLKIPKRFQPCTDWVWYVRRNTECNQFYV